MNLKVNKKIALIKQRLNKPLPAWDSQKKMVVVKVNKFIRMAFNPPPSAKLAAVAIILFPIDDDIGFFLTQRTSNVDHHKSQVSLPGGAQDHGETLLETSIRESKEEIGIDNNLEFIGNLTSLYTPVSDFLIHPYIWYAPSKPKTNLNQDEVSDIYTISYNELIHQQTLGTIPKKIRSITMDVPCFQFVECDCWGATAMILSEFKDCLLEI
jgi:8-oxo-dGTP pyrophosphatase MutT (NUDIX family)